MIVKMFKRGAGGGSGPVNYLLGKERNREGATLLRGDPDQIKALIDSSKYAQKYTSGVLSFVPWTFQAQTKGFKLRKVPPHEYLKMVALARLFFDNIPHIEVSIMVAGKQLGELALYFGADDINSPVIEENVLRSFGLKSTEESRQFIAEAGFTPVRRSFSYLRGQASDMG